MNLLSIFLVITLALGSFAAIQTYRLDQVRDARDAARDDFAQCEALLAATLEGDDIDAGIPHTLDGFTVPDSWFLPLVPERTD